MLADTLCAHFTTMNIAEAVSGEDALIKVEAFHPDMIFMDINLPGENGLEATRIIKMRHKNTLIAMLTSYDVPEYRQQAFHNGADHFISKADDSCLRNIIAWVEKAMADKITSSAQDSSSESRRATLQQRDSSARDCLPGAGLDLAACLL
jgi:DNA-binding NarL/FixJ family response regulator